MTELAQVKNFLEQNRVLALATVDEKNNPHVAVVFYCYKDGHLYFSTEKGSQKAQNILKHKQIALVVVKEEERKTLQINGEATLVTDPDERLDIIMRLHKQVPHTKDSSLPVTQLHPQNLEAFGITIKRFAYSHFGEKAVTLKGTGEEFSLSHLQLHSL